MKRSLLAVPLFVVLLGSLALGGDDADDRGRVELVRDRWGVPHVFAETDAGAFYGLGWACAEDRAFQMYLDLRTVQGRLAEVIGDAKWRGDKRGAVLSDVKMRTFGFWRAAQELPPNLDAETRALLTAYADGVNDYVSAHRDDLHPLFEKTGLDPEPWTPAACIAVWWQLGKYFATEGLHDTMVYHRLADEAAGRRPARPRPARRVDDSAAVVRRADVSEEWVARVQAFAARQKAAAAKAKTPSEPPETPEKRRKFSHAWVVAGSHTTTGAAVLCSDPQTPVRNPSLLYEFHIRGASFDARGVGVAGSPVILIGWNRRVAWGMTALGADQADQLFLHTDPARPDEYRFDGEWRKMDVRREQIRVRGAEPRPITLRRTHLGPVVSAIAHDVRRGEQVAMRRVPVCDTDRETVQAAIAMMRATDVATLDAALRAWRFPSANVVFGDAAGRIGYRAVGAFPLRSPHAVDGPNATHDGSTSAGDWRGFLDPDLAPHAFDPARGFFASGNNRPIQSFYAIDVGIRTGFGGDTSRSRRLRELLVAALAPASPEGSERASPEGIEPPAPEPPTEPEPPTRKLTPEDVFAMHHDRVNPGRRDIVALGLHLRDALAADLGFEAHLALLRLEPWLEKGARMDTAEPGAELALLIPTFFRIVRTPLAGRHGGGEGGLHRFLKDATSRIARDPKAPLDADERAFVEDALVDAWLAAERRWGEDPERWTERFAAERARQKLGAFVTLTGFASLDRALDVAVPALGCVDGGTINSQGAQSYTQLVSLHDPDAAMSILPPGQSERPDDPARLANLELWGEDRLHPAPLSRAAVKKIEASARVLAD